MDNKRLRENKKTQNKPFLHVIFKKWHASNGSKKMNVDLGLLPSWVVTQAKGKKMRKHIWNLE